MLMWTSNMYAQNISGLWTGTLEVGANKLNINFNFLKDLDGKEICTMDSPDQSLKSLPANLLFISKDSVSVSLPNFGITYTGKLHEKIIKGKFSQMGMTFNLNLTEGIIEYKRPQNPELPYPYITEDVIFTNTQANLTLSGTITYPVNYKKGDKVPVLLMVSGSGGQNRDSEIYEHKFFLVIADYFARNGIATLRYDDRGVGKSICQYQAMNTSIVADDARYGIKFLRKREEFSKVGLLGHSEGASVAYMLGAKNLLDFMISMAAPGVKGDECLYEQAKTIAESAGQKYPFTKEQFTAMILAQQNPWLNYFIGYDPTVDIRNTTCPVFAINGDKDVQIIPSLNIAAIEKNLPSNKQTVVKIYPRLNHLFQECETGLPTEYSKIEQTISPVVLRDMVDWINAL